MSEMNGAAEVERSKVPKGGGLWPFWRKAYEEGDPLPEFKCQVNRPNYSFDEGDELPDEYRTLLYKMLRHEGERAGNKSFLALMGSCAELTEAVAPSEEAKLVKSEYLAEELKHAMMFHRLAVGFDREFALRDVPYTHYIFHLPKESWAEDALFHFFADLNGAFHARDWRESSYIPLRKISHTVERDELGHAEMGYYFLAQICSESKGKALVQRLLPRWYAGGLDMFGRSDSPNAPRFIHWGLKSVGNADIRAAYKQYADVKLAALGLEIPDERKNRLYL